MLKGSQSSIFKNREQKYHAKVYNIFFYFPSSESLSNKLGEYHRFLVSIKLLEYLLQINIVQNNLFYTLTHVKNEKILQHKDHKKKFCWRKATK